MGTLATDAVPHVTVWLHSDGRAALLRRGGEKSFNPGL